MAWARFPGAEQWAGQSLPRPGGQPGVQLPKGFNWEGAMAITLALSWISGDSSSQVTLSFCISFVISSPLFLDLLLLGLFQGFLEHLGVVTLISPPPLLLGSSLLPSLFLSFRLYGPGHPQD